MSIDVALTPLQKKTSCFHPSQLSCLDWARIPHHIAIIPDGNRRWARRRLSKPQEGHREGADTLMEIITACQELGVKVLTLYAFSTENWERPPEEVDALMALFADYLLTQKANMVQTGIKLETMGDSTPLPLFLKEIIDEIKLATQDCNQISLVLALNYGSRNEMCRAFQAIINDYDQKLIRKEQIDEKLISQYLDSSRWQDPDLLIRTSGELRVSNFLLWQISYTEIHAAPVLWPDFTPQHLIEAILDYQQRDRRWGGD